jgi:hypothetical protein
MYLEAAAMLPQIFMFQKQASDQGGIVEVSHLEEDLSGYSEHCVQCCQLVFLALKSVSEFNL